MYGSGHCSTPKLCDDECKATSQSLSSWHCVMWFGQHEVAFGRGALSFMTDAAQRRQATDLMNIVWWLCKVWLFHITPKNKDIGTDE